MNRIPAVTVAAALVAAAAPCVVAQSLQNRVNQAPDGRVQFSFAARPGVCGNGRTYYSTGPGNYNGVFYNDGYRTEPCVPGPVRVVIDRTFIDDKGQRWIIDFKTSSHEGGDREAFLDREVQRYRSQLELYARLLEAAGKVDVRLGLYFPLIGGWREWSAGEVPQ